MAVKILVNTVRVGQVTQFAGTSFDTSHDADMILRVQSVGGRVVDPSPDVNAAAALAQAGRARGDDIPSIDAIMLAAIGGGGGGGDVPSSRTLTAGAGLTGGGDLSADRTFACAFGSAAGTVCQGNDPRLSDARAPIAHAASHVTGGGDVIANAVPSGSAGLMTGADKAKLDGMVSGHAIIGDGVTFPQRVGLYFRGFEYEDEPIDDHTLVQFPRTVTTAERIALSPFPGQTVFDSDLQRLATWGGASWRMP